MYYCTLNKLGEYFCGINEGKTTLQRILLKPSDDNTYLSTEHDQARTQNTHNHVNIDGDYLDFYKEYLYF